MKKIIKVLGVSVHPISHKHEGVTVKKISPALRATDGKCPHCFYMVTQWIKLYR